VDCEKKRHYFARQLLWVRLFQGMWAMGSVSVLEIKVCQETLGVTHCLSDALHF
jgi:hypothetical protein